MLLGGGGGSIWIMVAFTILIRISSGVNHGHLLLQARRLLLILVSTSTKGWSKNGAAGEPQN